MSKVSPATMAMQMAHLAQVAEAIHQMFPDGAPVESRIECSRYCKLVKKFEKAQASCQVADRMKVAMARDWTVYRSTLFEALVPMEPDTLAKVREQLARAHVEMERQELFAEPEDEDKRMLWDRKRQALSRRVFQEIKRLLADYSQSAFSYYFAEDFLLSAWPSQLEPETQAETVS